MSRAVVVGSGPNGLAAAIRLAQAGLEVTVLEAYSRPGGGTRTDDQLTVPGVVHDVCSGFHPTGVASPYLASLDLERHGLRWLWPEVDLAHPLNDGRAALAARDMELSAASLGVDGARWRRIFDPIVRDFDDLVEEVFQPVAHLPRHPVTLGRFGVKALMPATWQAARFRDEPAKALMTGIAAHKFGALTGPLGSSVGLLLGGAAHAVGWPVAEGGSEAITRAMLAELTGLGGTVRSGVRVTSLASLAELVGSTPDVVMLDTAPAGVLEIVGDRLPGRVRRQLQRFTYGPAAYKVDFAIEGRRPPRAARCPSGRSCCWASSTSWTRAAPWGRRTRSTPTPTSRTATAATPPRRSSGRSSGSPPASASRSWGCGCGLPRTGRTTTPTTSVATSPRAPTRGGRSRCARGPR